MAANDPPRGLVDHNGRPLDRFLGADRHANDGQALPHVWTFASIISGAYNTYFHQWDEAMRASRENALAMRRDPYLMALLQERKEGTVSMRWHLEPENEKDPWQQAVARGLTKILQATPRFRSLQRYLMEALWYGRYGSQLTWRLQEMNLPRPSASVSSSAVPGSGGGTEYERMRALVVDTHTPVHGDKIGHFHDHTPYILANAAYINQIRGAEVTTTSRGMAVALSGTWRDRFIIHRTSVDDADYFEAEMAESIHGVGLRSKLNFASWLRSEWLSWVSDSMEKTGLGVVVVEYDASNPQAYAQAQSVAKNISRKSVIVIPVTKNGGEKGGAVRVVETPTAGAQVVLEMQRYMDQVIERYVIGQTLSAGTEGSGLGGSGVAALHAQTKSNILAADAHELAETLTGGDREPGLVSLCKKWTYPWADFKVSLAFEIDKPNAEQILGAASMLVNLDVPLVKDELRAVGGFSKPTEDDDVSSLSSIQQAQAPQQPGGVPGQPNPGGGPATNDNPVDVSKLLGDMQPDKGGGGTSSPLRRRGRALRYAAPLEQPGPGEGASRAPALPSLKVGPGKQPSPGARPPSLQPSFTPKPGRGTREQVAARNPGWQQQRQQEEGQWLQGAEQRLAVEQGTAQPSGVSPPDTPEAEPASERQKQPQHPVSQANAQLRELAQAANGQNARQLAAGVGPEQAAPAVSQHVRSQPVAQAMLVDQLQQTDHPLDHETLHAASEAINSMPHAPREAVQALEHHQQVADEQKSIKVNDPKGFQNTFDESGQGQLTTPVYGYDQLASLPAPGEDLYFRGPDGKVIAVGTVRHDGVEDVGSGIRAHLNVHAVQPGDRLHSRAAEEAYAEGFRNGGSVPYQTEKLDLESGEMVRDRSGKVIMEEPLPPTARGLRAYSDINWPLGAENNAHTNPIKEEIANRARFLESHGSHDPNDRLYRQGARAGDNLLPYGHNVEGIKSDDPAQDQDRWAVKHAQAMHPAISKEMEKVGVPPSLLQVGGGRNPQRDRGGSWTNSVTHTLLDEVYPLWQRHLAEGGKPDPAEFHKLLSQTVQQAFPPDEHPYDAMMNLLDRTGNPHDVDREDHYLRQEKRKADRAKAMSSHVVGSNGSALDAAVELQQGKPIVSPAIPRGPRSGDLQNLAGALGGELHDNVSLLTTAAREILRRKKLFDELPGPVQKAAESGDRLRLRAAINELPTELLDYLRPLFPQLPGGTSDIGSLTHRIAELAPVARAFDRHVAEKQRPPAEQLRRTATADLRGTVKYARVHETRGLHAAEQWLKEALPGVLERAVRKYGKDWNL